MDDSAIYEKLELYSNAIVGFVVIQAITFCYNFGTNAVFSDILIRYKILSSILSLATVIVMLLALYANYYLGSAIQKVTEKHRETIKTIYFGKSVVIVIFSALQVGIIVFFGVLNDRIGW